MASAVFSEPTKQDVIRQKNKKERLQLGSRLRDVVEPFISNTDLTTEKLAERLKMDIKTLEKILNQSFASDDFIEKLTEALNTEPKLLENFKFSAVIINQIAASNTGATVHQSASNHSEKDLYERIIAAQNDRLKEQQEQIEFLKLQLKK